MKNNSKICEKCILEFKTIELNESLKLDKKCKHCQVIETLNRIYKNKLKIIFK